MLKLCTFYSNFVVQALLDKDITIYGDGKQTIHTVKATLDYSVLGVLMIGKR